MLRGNETAGISALGVSVIWDSNTLTLCTDVIREMKYIISQFRYLGVCKQHLDRGNKMLNIKGVEGLAKRAINRVVIAVTNCLSSVAVDKAFYLNTTLIDTYMNVVQQPLSQCKMICFAQQPLQCHGITKPSNLLGEIELAVQVSRRQSKNASDSIPHAFFFSSVFPLALLHT